MVSDHREGLIAARTTWQNARAICADRERPDLAPLQLALENATQELKTANDALSAARSDVSSLTKFKESLAEALAKTERLETETGPLRGLRSQSRAPIPQKRLWVWRCTFDVIAVEPRASHRARLERG